MKEAHLWRARALQDDVFGRNVSSLGALVWLIWECIITGYNEYQHIWRGPMNRVKLLYLFSRYLAICAQVANTYIVFFPLSILPVPRDECQIWLIFLTVCACLLLAALDLVIMLRVYALYNRSLKLGLFLAFLLLIQAAVVTACTRITVPHVPFGPSCDALETPADVIYFMATVVFSQTVLLILTVRKRKVAFGQSPLIDLVVRDGAWVFVLIVSMFVAIIPYSFIVQVFKPHIIFVWPITLLSVTACRLILNMQKITVSPVAGQFSGQASTNTNIAFTSYIDFNDEGSPPSTLNSRARTPVNLDLQVITLDELGTS
ncbi:hypothetical protein GALMADRAFT_137227 [Galerina marginata CBS 339.88]|uniref:DUF6533 domain-containing protein n=1 Tax=Galerina marginata (strain CBS 339.88) TaxID=685588 RepID=A0A067T868_GALM3|nr:hypothetical protein GALMADRAFT_137227 [Galerina marginata CBS 339.88]